MLPGVPTLKDSVVPVYVAKAWYGLFMPKGTPDDIVNAVNAAANSAPGESEGAYWRVEMCGQSWKRPGQRFAGSVSDLEADQMCWSGSAESRRVL